MRILSVEHFSADFLLSTLRSTRLTGFGGARPYRDATLEIVQAMEPEALSPAQNYVLTRGVDKILELRTALLREELDIFALNGGVFVMTSDDPDARIPLIPPVVEKWREGGGGTVLLINDGIHRCYAARSLGLPISVVMVSNVPEQYPYYALALQGGWSKVAAAAKLPDGHQRKGYRNLEDHKALFRDFNALFPGIQKYRTHSDPSHRAK